MSRRERAFAALRQLDSFSHGARSSILTIFSAGLAGRRNRNWAMLVGKSWITRSQAELDALMDIGWPHDQA